MIKSLLCGLTIGSVGTLLSMQYHLVRTDERFLIVSRTHQPPLRSSYVDIRHWSSKMWEHYPELQEAMVKAGRQDLMADKKPVPVEAGSDITVPLHDVSKSGTTSIFHASEARNTQAVKRPVGIAELDNSTSIVVPKIALGQAETSHAVAVPAISGPNPPTMQRTVPQPLEMVKPAPAVPSSVARPNVENETAAAPNRDWVRNLLKTIVPGTGPVASAESEESGASQIVTSSNPDVASRDQELEVAFPASPRRISVAQ